MTYALLMIVSLTDYKYVHEFKTNYENILLEKTWRRSIIPVRRAALNRCLILGRQIITDFLTVPPNCLPETKPLFRLSTVCIKCLYVCYVRRKAEEERMRKEDEKARRELIKQEYLRRKQQELMEEQGMAKPRPHRRRPRPKSLHRGQSGTSTRMTVWPIRCI